MDLVVKTVKALAWLAGDLGLSSNWFQFSKLQNCTDGEEYVYVIMVLLVWPRKSPFEHFTIQRKISLFVRVRHPQNKLG